MPHDRYAKSHVIVGIVTSVDWEAQARVASGRVQVMVPQGPKEVAGGDGWKERSLRPQSDKTTL